MGPGEVLVLCEWPSGCLREGLSGIWQMAGMGLACGDGGSEDGTDGAGGLGPNGLRGTLLIWAKPYINKTPDQPP